MSKTDFISYFCGNLSETETYIDTPRSKPCGSCAFTNSKDTVRPKDISLLEMMQRGSTEFDVFYCHEKEGEGFKICAAWYANCSDFDLTNLAINNKEIEAILNTD